MSDVKTVLTASAEMLLAIAYQPTVRKITVITRARRVGRMPRTESTPVSTLSIPP